MKRYLWGRFLAIYPLFWLCFFPHFYLQRYYMWQQWRRSSVETASLYSGSRWIFSVFHAYVLQNWRVVFGLYSVPLRCFSCTLAHDSAPGSCFRRRRSSLCLVGLLFCGKSGAALSHIDWPAAVVFHGDLFGRVSPIPLDSRNFSRNDHFGTVWPWVSWILDCNRSQCWSVCNGVLFRAVTPVLWSVSSKGFALVIPSLFWSLPCTSLGYYLGDSPRSCQPPCNASLLG